MAPSGLRLASHTWALGACQVVAGTVSFSLAPLVSDSGVFTRMAAKHGWSMPPFHTGNVVLHLLPAVVAGLTHAPTAIGP